jgi:hypothetical protein
MPDIVWEDPPDTAGRGGGEAIRAFVAELKAHPGKWALWKTYDSDGSAAGSQQYLKRYYGCEARRRTIDGEHRVYARWPEDAS